MRLSEILHAYHRFLRYRFRTEAQRTFVSIQAATRRLDGCRYWGQPRRLHLLDAPTSRTGGAAFWHSNRSRNW